MDARTIVVVAAVIGFGGQSSPIAPVVTPPPGVVLGGPDFGRRPSTSTSTCQSCSSSGIVSDAECQRGELLAGGFFLAFDDQLSARRANVSAAALAHGYGHVMIGEDLREAIDRFVRRPLERNPGGGVERNEIHLALHARQQPGEPSR